MDLNTKKWQSNFDRKLVLNLVPVLRELDVKMIFDMFLKQRKTLVIHTLSVFFWLTGVFGLQII